MQLGVTIPLQKHLKIKTLPYGEQADLFYCWELHIIRLQGKNTLAAVNASNRFAIVLWGMKAPQWKTREEVMRNGIRQGFLSEGYTGQQVNAYFEQAGEVSLTKTHGRSPVATVCSDHVHLCVSLPPKYSVSDFVGYLKGKSALMIFDKHPELTTKWTKSFWARGYYVATVGNVTEEAIKKYIREQSAEAEIEETRK